MARVRVLYLGFLLKGRGDTVVVSRIICNYRRMPSEKA